MKRLFNMQTFIVTIFIWLNLNISGIQNIYFSGGTTLTIIVIKILHFLFLYAIFLKIYSLYKNRKIPKVKNEIIISLIYFVILMILLLLVWPGTWADDDITILRNAGKYEFTPWQHFFSGLFHIMCLQTIPIPSGVMIIQSLISALIVGYCISNISALYGKSKNQIVIIQIILLLIALFPPLILYILSGFRMGIYAYLELALITKMIVLYKEKKKIVSTDILKISFLTIIISCWRTEAIYFPIFILILFLILGQEVIRRKVAVLAFLIIMIINFSIGKTNNVMIKNENYLVIKDNNYSISATMEPLSRIIEICDETDKENIEIINKVIEVKYILENPNQTGEQNFWAEGVVKEYSEEEYINFFKAYLRLVLKYPDVAFKSMWNLFVKTGNGFGENSKQTTKNLVANTQRNTLQLYEEYTPTWIRWNSVNSKVQKYKEPINLELRNDTILFLNGSDSNNNLTIIHNIFWNLFIPFTLILICLIYKLIKKDWYIVFLILTIIARVAIVFATAPAQYFMYYLSAYLCSYVVSVIVLVESITGLKNKRRLLCEKNY